MVDKREKKEEIRRAGIKREKKADRRGCKDRQHASKVLLGNGQPQDCRLCKSGKELGGGGGEGEVGRDMK